MKAEKITSMMYRYLHLKDQAFGIGSDRTRDAVCGILNSAQENACENDYDPGTIAIDVFESSVGVNVACNREDYGYTKREWSHVRKWFSNRGLRG